MDCKYHLGLRFTVIDFVLWIGKFWLFNAGKEFDVHAKLIINAAGPFCDEVRKLADKEASALSSPRLLLS